MNPRIPDRGDSAIVMAFLRKLSPIKNQVRFTDEYWSDLHSELRIHQRIAELICISAMIIGFFSPLYFTGTFQPWDIGLGFGLMALAPIIYIFTVGVYKGIGTTMKRYADYSTMMYAIPWKAQFYWIGLPALFIGALCLCGRLVYPVDIRKLSSKTEQGAAANP